MEVASSSSSAHGQQALSSVSIGTLSKPTSPCQIHLPLKKPTILQQLHHRPPLPPPPSIISPPNKKNNTTPTTNNNHLTDVLRLMDGLGLPIPVDIYTSLVKECTETRDPAGASALVAHINKSGIRPGLHFLNRILLMYVACGLIGNAHRLFGKMPVKDFNSWAAMVAGYIDNDKYEEGICLFVEMMRNHQNGRRNANMLGFPYSWIVVCILKACVHTKNLGLGKQIHGWLTKIGYLSDLFLSSSLMNLYGKLGGIEGVDCVFDRMPCRGNTVVWTAKIVNLCREMNFDEVLNVFNEMGREGVKKNEYTFSSVLRACGRMEDDGKCGEKVHASVIKLGLELNDYVQCGLVDMYSKRGLLRNARTVFETVGGQRTDACWNAMLTGYIQHGDCIEAMKVLYAMKSAGLQPKESILNEVMFTCGSRNLENQIEGL
ncbi:hypothetical protein RHMOL_Rhmol09G0081100 [Rhododendron molle]|uniref:Uncharacterized protein n=1 Tax=Rhododendron molle TaxID=49168 RepID=A0ACC0MB98_RHOML|nr:hypothetical protein RHMOL_Rhmol09G0081100 [Rhododendron molle]